MIQNIKKWPIYAPLNITFDRKRIMTELLHTEPRWVPLAPGRKTVKEIPYFMVADQKMYENAEYLENQKGKTTYIAGNPTWKGVSFRHIEGMPGSHIASASFMMENFMKYDWKWDDSFNIPYIREIVDSIPYEKLEVVRVMVIDPGGFGPTHRDSTNDHMWEDGGLTSTTLTVDYGGSHMLTEHEGKIFPTDAPAFFFKDSAPHGVPPVQWRRMIVRIHGKANYEKYNALLDHNHAVW